MKSKDLFGLLINPFTRIAGWQAFGLGLVFIALMGVLGPCSGVFFDGVIDMHVMGPVSYAKAFAYLGIDVVCLVLAMWVAGLTVTKNFRFLDILGTMTLSKAPYVLGSLLGCFLTFPDLSNLTALAENPYVLFKSASFIALLVLSLPVAIWSITLMYNAFKVSCGINGRKLTIAFIVALLVAEALSKALSLTLVL